MFETMTVQETCAAFKTDQNRGLSLEEVQRRLRQEGENVLKTGKRKSAAQRFWEQLADPLIYVLLTAAAISMLLHEISDAAIILFVVTLNGFAGMLQEGKAQRALDSLQKLAQPKAYVIREGQETEVLARNLVCGDLVCLEPGCQIPADLRLIRTERLQTEEAALTGEAVPVDKDAAFCAPKQCSALPLGDRRNMAYMSTIVTGGRARGIVTATGMQTQIGQIAAMMEESSEELTPLQKKLGELGKILSFLSLGICVALFLLAIFQKRNVFDMLLVAISLAVAAVPEGLPAVVTLCLALSVTRMARGNAIIRRLPCVETLGAVNVVCSDKTGTLTQNRMEAVLCLVDLKLCAADSLHATRFLETMALCNDAVIEPERIGDPTELALLDLAERCGIRRSSLIQRFPRTGELVFDSGRKMMSTCHSSREGSLLCTKGAPDRVLEKCTSLFVDGKTEPMTADRRRQIERAMEQMAEQALRTLAVAQRRGTGQLTEEGLTFLGLVGLQDPVRPEAKEAVETFRSAGITTVMITGDHAATALAVGQKLCITDRRAACMTGSQLAALSDRELCEALERVRIFARVSPADKVRIVRAFRQKGCIVAMTGDGVNDAPSLKTADVGIAMGKNGTDVARQAADMILADDNFATIKTAVEEGRGVYENIRKSVIFLLSSNLGEIVTMFAAVLLTLPSPLQSGHILWINLITDSLPALALGVDQNDRDALMRRPPRGVSEGLFAQGGLQQTLFYGLLIAGISLAAFFVVPWQMGVMAKAGGLSASIGALLSQKEVLARAQTYAFTVLGMSQLFHAIGMRDTHRSVFRMKHLENKMMLLAVFAGFGLQFAVTRLPFLVRAFGTVCLSRAEWLFLTGLAAFPLLAHELFLLTKKGPACG